MKICYLANASSIHTQRWAEAMRDKGCIVDIISFEKAEIEGVNVHYIRPIRCEISENSADSKSISYIMRAHIVKKVLGEIRPDIVHAHYATGYGLTGALCKAKPYIISTWGSDVCLAPRKNRLFKYVLKYNLKRADYVTATSRDLTRETSLYTNKKVITIPFGVDTSRFSNRHQGERNNITIGIVKSLETIYGVRYLIEAFARLCKRYQNIELLIVGDGPLRKELEELCRRLHVEDKVIFAGGIPNSGVPVLLNNMDIFVMPSLSESFGVSILEAESCEIPVIATEVGGIPEVVVNGRTGFLVKPADSGEIEQKLSKLIEDKALREKMGKEGRKFVEENYDWNDSVEQMYRLYKDILNKKVEG